MTWLVWFLACLAAFAVLEALAIANNRPTLSQAIRNLSAEWPLTQGVLCLIVGGLASHWWWPWTACGG